MVEDQIEQGLKAELRELLSDQIHAEMCGEVELDRLLVRAHVDQRLVSEDPGAVPQPSEDEEPCAEDQECNHGVSARSACASIARRTSSGSCGAGSGASRS